MSLTRCRNGHFYQSAHYDACPFCKDVPKEDAAPRLSFRFARLGSPTRLGVGATSTVWRLGDGELAYALKQIHCGGDDMIRQRALHEIRMMIRTAGGPGVMPLLDGEETDPDSVWLLMPCLKTLSERIAEEDFHAADAIRMVIDVCETLAYCQSCGVLHLDVQPKNLYLDEKGRTVLGDFGTALTVEEAAQQQSPRGTLAYMAPEVYREGRVSLQSDLYSLGLVLYGLFNEHRLPFMTTFGDEDTAVYKRLAGTELPVCAAARNAGPAGERLMAVIRRMCAFRPEDRYPDASSCKDDLLTLLPWADSLHRRPASDRRGIIAQPDYGDTVPDFLTASAGPGGDSCFSEASFDEDGCGSAFEDGAAFFDADEFATTMPMADREESAGYALFDAPALTVTGARPGNRGAAERPFLRPPVAPPVMAQEAPVQIADECRVCGRVVQVGAVFCQFCGSRQQPLQASVPISRVNFSAVAPKTLVKGEYSMIHVMMYEEAFRHAVDEVIREADGPVSETKSGAVRAKLGARVLIRLTSPDLPIEDGEEEREWAGEYLQFTFAVMLPEDFRKKQVLFTAAVYVDGVIATRLKFTARCFSLREQKLEVLRSDVLSAFVSYASQDRARVAAIVQGMQRARPDMDIFFDVETLRSGADWEKTLYGEIERRDVLYLCWSRSASGSDWVRREWQYAYETKGVDCIEPIPIDPPDECPPPTQLAGKHFNDRLLYLMKVLEQK